MFRRKRREGSQGADPAETYIALRQQVLGFKTQDLGDGSGPDAPVIALLMETGYAEAVATLVGVVDGTTSLYFSNGGGVIGAGGHSQVADATRRWLATGGASLPRFSAAGDVQLPAQGVTQFVAVTPDGALSAAAPEEELGRGGHPLSRLFFAGQDVITCIRLTQEAE